METLHSNTGGRIENPDSNASNLGYWDNFFCCLCPDVNIVCGASNNDGHMYW